MTSVFKQEYVDILADGEVAHVWLTRPEKRNALSSAVLEQILAAFHFLQQQRGDLRVVVLGGRGRCFSAGADLRSGASGGDAAPQRVTAADRRASQLGRRVIQAIEEIEAITVARVQGAAIGGGFGLMLACDLRVSTSAAVLSLPEAKLGLPLTWGLTAKLASEVGSAAAKEIIMFGEAIDPHRLHSLGVLNRVVADEPELDAAVGDMTARLLQQQSRTMHMVKVQFRALQARSRLGDVTESDGDLLLLSRAKL